MTLYVFSWLMAHRWPALLICAPILDARDLLAMRALLFPKVTT